MLDNSDFIGAVGVAILLVAFLLNILGRLDARTRTYSALNLVGAGLSCYASFLIDYVPFVVLEGVWAVVALFGLLRPQRAASH